MTNVDDILKSMLDEMRRYKNEYNEVTAQVNDIIRVYTEKINELQKQALTLQDEGNKKIDILNAKREQLSGKHSSLYEQYKKFTGKEPEYEDENKAEVDVKVNSDKAKPVETKPTTKKSVKKEISRKEDNKTTPVKEETGKADVLSPEEIAKLAEITGENKSNKNLNIDKNGNEIPEYLQDAYKK